MTNYCPLPFGHTTISTNGSFYICCYHSTPPDHVININQHNYSVWNNSTYIKEVRDSFKNNLKHPGCNICWRTEAYDQLSLRQRVLKEYKILKVTDTNVTNYPVNIEIQLGNLCNLKCLMCNEISSSSILAENKVLGINMHNQKDFQWNSEAFDNLSALLNTGPKIVSIRGGEPLYSKDLLKLVENLNNDAYSHTMLHITTNATNWNDRWADALKKFKLVRLMLSIDATGELYEYIRYPADWDAVVKNVDSIKKQGVFKLLIHSVVQNINITQIGDLIKWAKQQDIYLQLDQICNPAHLSITNLPHDLKQKAITHINQLLKEEYDDHILTFLLICKQQLVDALEQPFDHELWNNFQLLIGQRDQIRGNSYTKFL